jgi:hypothetical protein
MDNIDQVKEQQIIIDNLLAQIEYFKILFQEKRIQIDNQWIRIRNLCAKHNLDTSSIENYAKTTWV